MSVLPGQAVKLHVSTVDRQWQVTAYRMGWYGGALAHASLAIRQRAGRPSAQTDPVPPPTPCETAWRPSLTLPTADWPPGAYLLRLDGRTGQRYVPLTIRSPDTAGRTVLILPVTTWQAYNDWGGYSLYHGPGGLNDFDNRSVAVSFDRPSHALMARRTSSAANCRSLRTPSASVSRWRMPPMSICMTIRSYSLVPLR